MAVNAMPFSAQGYLASHNTERTVGQCKTWILTVSLSHTCSVISNTLAPCSCQRSPDGKCKENNTWCKSVKMFVSLSNIAADCHHYPVRWAQRKPPLLLKFGMQLCKPNQDFYFKRDFEFPADECYVLCYGFMFPCDRLSILLRFQLKAVLLVHAAKSSKSPIMLHCCW